GLLVRGFRWAAVACFLGLRLAGPPAFPFVVALPLVTAFPFAAAFPFAVAARAGARALPFALAAPTAGTPAGGVPSASSRRIRPANSTRHTLATMMSPSTDSGSRYGDAPLSP